MYTVEQAKAIITAIFVVGESVDSFQSSELINLLQFADNAYFNEGDSLLTDDQYDSLKQLVHRAVPTHQYFIGIGSEVRGGKVDLPYTMGSLDQIYQGDYVKWVSKHSISKDTVVISDKLDGTSCMLVYDNTGKLQIAYSRGDGYQGADITRHVSRIHNVPRTIDPIKCGGRNLVVRAEVILPPIRFNKIRQQVLSRSGKPYKNPRNMVAGIMNASENDDIVYSNIDVVVYQIVNTPDLSKTNQLALLADLGFSVVKYSTHVADTLNDALLTNLLIQRKAASAYELDGVVIEVDSESERERINPATDTLNPAYAVKFKVADASNYAEPLVTGVTWAISKDGYYKPTINIEPTVLVGVTIQNCTGFNAKFIFDNGIGPGARIALVRSGDVIPFCQRVISPSPSGPAMPDGDAVWTETGVDLVVADADNNAVVKFEQLVDFFATLDVAHLGEGNLRPMFDAGFDTPEDIITLDKQDIASLVRSPAIGAKIYASITDKLTNIPEYKLMGAHASFGRGVGVRKMKKLWEASCGNVDMLQSMDFIMNVEGFEQKTATKVVSGLPKYQAFKNTISHRVSFAPYEAPKEGKLTGSVVVFTGFRSAALEQRVVDAGGKMGSSISKNTTYLVADDPNGTSTKLQKARSLGVNVISVADLQDLL